MAQVTINSTLPIDTDEQDDTKSNEYALRIAWDKHYEALIQFKLENKHCRVPYKYKENPLLGFWVNTQRATKNKLPADKIQKLNDIGFDWTPHETVWNEMYESLVQFKLENNHFRVNHIYKENPQLGSWVSTQRANKNKLSEDKIQKLNDIGFEWTPFKTDWNEMYESLVQFKLENKHCRVPIRYKEQQKLGIWVSTQRTNKNKLSADKIQMLNEIVFDWTPFETAWNKMYESLVQFKLENKHCRVPQRYKENPPLGAWVSTQRANKNKLSEDKLKKLNDIGFY